jgi:5-methylcytosine-specific restriction endonuclease McrA
MTESRYVSSKLRKLVAERANFVCEYCKSQENFSADSFSVEHIKPIVLGGKTIFTNLAYSCLGCNSHKSVKIEAIDPISNKKFPLFNPRTHIWEEHFTWVKNLPKSSA